MHCLHSCCSPRIQRRCAISLFGISLRSLLTQSHSTFSFGTIVPTSRSRCARIYFQFKPFNFSLSNLAMPPPDPPPNFLPTHLVPWFTSSSVSSAPVRFVHDNGTAFLRQNLAHPASIPVTVPSPLMQLAHGLWPVPLAGVLCMPLHFMVWGVPRVSLWRGPCAPGSLMTLLLRGLVARILKRICLGHTSAMGFNWHHHTLLWSMGSCWLPASFAPWPILRTFFWAYLWGVPGPEEDTS